ncbi:MAG: hypothetical protein EU530_06415 [Promethearchaeota archaeon]|nr:MAG: hypothetical protein EU530_06415 [Candidatus Lokiarchaeota archaeon]
MLLKNIIDYLENFLHKYEHCPTKKFVLQVGPQYNYSEKIVKKVLITQYITLQNIVYAKKLKCNLIICKFGLPFDIVAQIDETLQKSLYLLQQCHIMVGILPTSWYYVTDGPIDYLAKMLNLHFDKIFSDPYSNHVGTVYSRDASLEFEPLLSTLQRVLNIEIIHAVSKTNPSHKVFYINPASISPNEVKNAKFLGCDCIICPELSSASLSVLNFYDISYVQISFHSLMEASLNRFCSILAMEFPRNEFEFYPSETKLQSFYRKQNH